MGLKVGMYIRTFDGKIGKIEYIDDILIDCDNEVYDDFLEIPISLEKKLIKNASYNIADLIEIGDYVNGEHVLNIERTEDKLYFDFSRNRYIAYSITNKYGDVSYGIDLSIDSIVTKEQFKNVATREQFENIAYKVRNKKC